MPKAINVGDLIKAGHITFKRNKHGKYKKFNLIF
jgi:hypothetical protein